MKRVVHPVILAVAFGAAGALQGQTTNLTLEQLDQKVRILGRKLELADEAAAAKEKETARVSAGADGFSVASADKRYALKFRGYLQADARAFADDDAKAASDTFLLRRARLIFDGALGESFEFRIAPDFGNGKTELQDGYVDYKGGRPFNLRAGRFKVPFGLERLQSSADTLFAETALSTALTPNYDEGVQGYGSLLSDGLEYAVGVFNGGPDGASVDADTNDGKDLAGRLVATPFVRSDIAALSGLSIGLGATWGDQAGSETAPGLPSFKSAGQQSVFAYATSTNKGATAYADGFRTRLAPQLYYAAGPVGILGEYVVSGQEVANGTGSDKVQNKAWQLAGSYVLTGETPSLKGIRPLKPFKPSAGQWGAVELAVRVGGLDIDDAAFDGNYADPKKAVSSARETAVGVNWYLTRQAKVVLDYAQTAFEDGASSGDRPDEKVVIARAQVSF